MSLTPRWLLKSPFSALIWSASTFSTPRGEYWKKGTKKYGIHTGLCNKQNNDHCIADSNTNVPIKHYHNKWWEPFFRRWCNTVELPMTISVFIIEISIKLVAHCKVTRYYHFASFWLLNGILRTPALVSIMYILSVLSMKATLQLYLKKLTKKKMCKFNPMHHCTSHKFWKHDQTYRNTISRESKRKRSDININRNSE